MEGNGNSQDAVQKVEGEVMAQDVSALVGEERLPILSGDPFQKVFWKQQDGAPDP